MILKYLLIFIKYYLLQVILSLTLDRNANTSNTQNGLSYYIGGITAGDLASATVIPRTNQSNVQFVNFESTGGPNGTLYFVDGHNKIGEFYIHE